MTRKAASHRTRWKALANMEQVRNAKDSQAARMGTGLLAKELLLVNLTTSSRSGQNLMTAARKITAQTVIKRADQRAALCSLNI
mmetsp:Transcript_83411/g.147748  ORF Transcript_83411/g.147748 Transcript_83411/m.147748 type:complete len:84 (-) Transcript_83411:135-386(-)